MSSFDSHESGFIPNNSWDEPNGLRQTNEFEVEPYSDVEIIEQVAAWGGRLTVSQQALAERLKRQLKDESEKTQDGTE